MEVTLWSILGWTSNRIAPQDLQDVLVCSDLQCSGGGAFVLHQLAAAALFSGFRVCVVSTEHSPNHYIHVLRRLGLKLSSARYKNTISFIEVLGNKASAGAAASASPSVAVADMERAKGAKQHADEAQPFISSWTSIEQIDDMRALFQAVRDVVTRPDGDRSKPCVFIFDNLTTLSCMWAGPSGTRDCAPIHFFSYWDEYVKAEFPDTYFAVASIAQDACASADIEALASHFETMLQLRGLTTGKSLEIDGQMSCLKLRGRLPEQSPTILYRIGDSGVKYVQA
ncbi:Elongator complex protein 6 [Porphyridium purpureum]|nr:Elongator complex protein 6 [Porphyridium purpureum]|eukprot:POR8986..scf295_1